MIIPNVLRRFWFLSLTREGSQIVELAISLPVLLLVVVGTMDFGYAFDLKQELTNATRDGVRVASKQTMADITNATPLSVAAIHDAVDDYLLSNKINDCGLSTAAPTNAGLTWTYTASGCVNGSTLTLTIDRGNTFQTAATPPITMETTHVRISYPYLWHLGNLIRLFVPTANYALGVTQITSDSVMCNLN